MREFDTILVRYGELSLKQGTERHRFEIALLNHIRKVLPDAKVSRERGRIFVEDADVKKLTKIFGVVSVSPVKKLEFSGLEDLVAKATEFNLPPGSFAIRCQRSGTHQFTSQQIAAAVGQKYVEKGLQVNLTSPEHELFIEVRQSAAYLYTDSFAGPGGLPYGVEGRVVVLHEGPASLGAAWAIMRRGCEPILVGWAEEEARPLTGWAAKPLKYFKIVGNRTRATGLRAAATVAAKLNARAIVVGDSDLNLAGLDKMVPYPIFRPRLAMPKSFVSFGEEVAVEPGEPGEFSLEKMVF